MKYREGYKYQLAEDYGRQTSIFPVTCIVTPFLVLTTKGFLLIGRGYAYDGPSGPTFDTPSVMEGALVHDALYQLMRLELLSQCWRKEADLELKRICIESGYRRYEGKIMRAFVRTRAEYFYQAVKRFGGAAADPANKKEVIEV